MPSTSLLRLPTEVQIQIISHLLPSSTATIQSVLLTCKALYHIALPLSVELYINRGYNRHGRIRASTRNLDFLRYITLIKPELARHVKTIILGDFSTHHSDDWPLIESPLDRPDEKEAFQQMMEKIYPTGKTGDDKDAHDEWLTDLEGGAEDAQVVVLLVACHNLEQFLFGEPYKSRNFERLLRKAADPSQILDKSIRPLKNLKVAYQESSESKYGYLCFQNQAVNLFQLPQIRSYECIRPNGTLESGNKFQAIPRRSSSVEEIMLRGGSVTQHALGSMIGACKAVRSLEYIHGTIHMYDEEVMPGDLLKMLLPHAESLEHLHVNFDDTVWSEEGGYNKAVIGVKLKDLKALRTIVASMEDLTGLSDTPAEQQPSNSRARIIISLTECLPVNLEYLEIHGCEIAIVPLVQELLDVIAERDHFSKLKNVRLLFNAASTNKDDLHFAYPQDLIHLDVIFQSEENRQFDLVNGCLLDNVWHSTFCSRIRSGDGRERWLRYRGSDQARAAIDGGVLEVPSIDTPWY